MLKIDIFTIKNKTTMWKKWQNIIGIILFFCFLQQGYGQNGSISSLQLKTKESTTYDRMCTSATFTGNDFYGVAFKWTGTALDNSDTLVAELSSPTGDFNSPTELGQIQWNQASSNRNDIRIIFKNLPTTLNGKAYKIRVKVNSSKYTITPVETQSFEAHYKEFLNQQEIVINDGQSIELCSGNSKQISVKVKGQVRTDLSYIWYKNLQVIQGATTSTITVKETGSYNVRVDYGICTENDGGLSAPISVKIRGTQTLSIEGAANINVCSGKPHTFVANIKETNSNYIWYKDNQKIDEGIGKTSYTTSATGNVAGVYRVEMGNDPTCMLKSANVTLTLKDGFTTTITAPSGTVLLPGKSKVIGVTTTAVSPKYEWYKDTSTTPIAGQTSAQLTVTEAGEYYAKVTSQDECSVTKETDKIKIETPTSFKVEISYQSAYQDCKYDKVTLQVAKIEAQTAAGQSIAVNASDFDLFTFSWEKDATSSGQTGKTLTLTGASQNGKYKVKTTLASFSGTITDSNELDVKLYDADYIKIEGNSVVSICVGTTHTLTASVNDASATYKWFKDDKEIAGAGGPGKHTYIASDFGLYKVEITPSVGCPVTSSSVRIEKDPFRAEYLDFYNIDNDDKLTSAQKQTKKDEITNKIYYPNRGKEIKLELRIIPDNAQYTVQWYKDGNVIPNATGTSYNVTEKGAYHAVVTQTGGCNSSFPLSKREISEATYYDVTVEYRLCENTVNVKKIIAHLNNNKQTVVESVDYQYFTFQWQKDKTDIAGETKSFITISSGSGEYRVQLNGGNTYSNEVKHTEIAIKKPETGFQLSSGNNVWLLEPNKPLKLESSETSTDFNYQWYKIVSGREEEIQGANNPTLEVTTDTKDVNSAGYKNALGLYRLKVSLKDDPNCSITRDIEFKKYGLDELRIKDVPQDLSKVAFTIEIIEGVGARIDIKGAFDGYEVEPTDGVVDKETNSFRLTKEGNYALKIYAGTDPTTRREIAEITFNVEAVKIDKIPNIVIMSSSEDANNKWVLPEQYMNNAQYTVTIYAQTGKKVLEQNSYKGDWPPSSLRTENKGRANIFFYVIEKGGQIEAQGTITVLN